jgi:hypothetical protein
VKNNPKKVTKYLFYFLGFFVVYTFQSCSNLWQGFAGYDRPAKTSNKYYRKHFKLTNYKLKIGRQYIDLANQGLHANNPTEYSYFVFFENGFVLHNSSLGGKENKPNLFLDYSEIHSEDVGSYIIRGDTILWETRPGYLRKKMMTCYKAVISDTGLNVVNKDIVKVQFFRLR